MKSSKKIFVLLILAVFICIGFKLWFDSEAQAWQNDADIYRLRHLKYYGELIEEYYAKVGKYPLEDEGQLPVYVFVANREQEDDIEDSNPAPHKRYSFKELVQALEQGLGRPIYEYYDPQFVPVHKPNFYIYMIDGPTYYFAVHLSKSYGFAWKVSENYYKIEITNAPTEKALAITLSDLISNQEYLNVVNALPTKKAFFDNRAQKFLNGTKVN